MRKQYKKFTTTCVVCKKKEPSFFQNQPTCMDHLGFVNYVVYTEKGAELSKKGKELIKQIKK